MHTHTHTLFLLQVDLDMFKGVARHELDKVALRMPPL